MTGTYRDALETIYGLTDYEKKGFAAYAPEFYDLRRVRALLDLLGNPETQFHSVHIAGTKGKGSTAAICESVLRAAHYRTGLFTSPHLHTFRERMQVNGGYVPEETVVDLVRRIDPLAQRVDGITTFELMTAMAFAWFAEERVEWAVLEVGLGGRLDATNIVLPAVALITSISLDHVAILGDTVAKIAAEKAGIIKRGVPVVSAPQLPEALEVIEAACRRQDAPMTLVGRDWTWSSEWADLDGQAFTLRHQEEVLPGLWIPLLGEHQQANATTAVAALWVLKQRGLEMTEEAIRAGIRGVYWPGRLEVLSRAPLLVVDSAHNGDSAQKLRAALSSLCACEHLTMVVGASADHATPGLFQTLLSGADRAIVTRSHHPRAADASWMQSQANQIGFHVEMSESVSQALDLALASAGPQDMICFAGSVFLAAEARVAWFVRQHMPLPPSDPV